MSTPPTQRRLARQNNFGGVWTSFAVRGFVCHENLPGGLLARLSPAPSPSPWRTR